MRTYPGLLLPWGARWVTSSAMAVNLDTEVNVTFSVTSVSGEDVDFKLGYHVEELELDLSGCSTPRLVGFSYHPVNKGGRGSVLEAWQLCFQGQS